MVELNDQPGESVTPAALKYVNRLSDFLFVASRYVNDKGAPTCCGCRARTGEASGLPRWSIPLYDDNPFRCRTGRS